MKSSSSSGSLASRGDARISVAEKWANRRQQQLNASANANANANSNANNPSNGAPKRNGNPPPQPPFKGSFSMPPLCVLLRRSWNQAIGGFVQQAHSGNKITNKPQKRSTNAPTKQEGNKNVSFPSVLSILKENAVKLQVESMLREEEEEENENTAFDDPAERSADGNGIQTSAKTNAKPKANGLSVLPANVNDLNTSAVNHMSDSRSRAFLLLDFSAIVQTHTIWRKRLLLNKHPSVQMVYSARHNCNARLLQLLQRLGVGLRVATKYDLAAVREASGNREKDSMVWDDTSILVKPNSFYRNLLLRNEPRRTEEDGPKRTIPVTVDTPEEMERIQIQLHKICKRRPTRATNPPALEFVLRLNNEEHDAANWKALLETMQQKASELPECRVVGVALEIRGTDANATNGDGLLLDGLSGLMEGWVDGTRPQVHLTIPITATEIDGSVLEWIERHRKVCGWITIDVSRILMANAAALCARIIGVKSSDTNKNNGNDGNETALRDENAIRQHLYIDDGCYGSLSNYPNEGTPLPLKSQRFVRSLSANSKQLLETEQKTLVNTTVWGPTCDGLDKVCSKVALPRLSRDDWLVFTDLGFCNEGTCFNGFSPPDIACCVLGWNP